MFLEHNSNIVLEIVDVIMLYEHNVSGAYFVFCTNAQDFALLYSGFIIMRKVYIII
jgi:hypothetical protein